MYQFWTILHELHTCVTLKMLDFIGQFGVVSLANEAGTHGFKFILMRCVKQV